MDFRVNLDCKPGNSAAFFRHRSALLAATVMYNAYTASKEILIGTGPELYAEQWIHNYMSRTNIGFKDLVVVYFVKILQGAQND